MSERATPSASPPAVESSPCGEAQAVDGDDARAQAEVEEDHRVVGEVDVAGVEIAVGDLLAEARPHRGLDDHLAVRAVLGDDRVALGAGGLASLGEHLGRGEALDPVDDEHVARHEVHLGDADA